MSSLSELPPELRSGWKWPKRRETLRDLLPLLTLLGIEIAVVLLLIFEISR